MRVILYNTSYHIFQTAAHAALQDRVTRSAVQPILHACNCLAFL